MAELRIATRESPLALWQARHVAERLRAIYPDIDVELLPMTTTGDRLVAVSLAKVGGKGLFLKELERAIEAGEADLAVHSMKDVPAELPPGMCIAATLERADPRDAFVSNTFAGWAALPDGSRVGTSSLRRQCQLKALRSALEIVPLRGNVHTRLRKLDEGEYDAVILAMAGLERLGLGARARACLPVEQCLPAIGQGVIGIECRADDPRVRPLLEPLDHGQTRLRVTAERALNEGLEGSCHAPIAGYAEISDRRLRLRAVVGEPDGSRLIRGERSGPPDEARRIGLALADELLAAGARELLAALG